MLKKGDIFLIAGIILISVLGIIFFNFYNNNSSDKIAVIKLNNKVLRTINLTKVVKPYEYVINGAYKDTVLVEKGRIRFKDANCPDKVCVKTGWLTKNGQMSACLPNRAMIEIKALKPEVDGVAY